MFKQLNYFFNALTFYSRLPGPNWVEYSSEHLNRASRYFPLIGLIVASLCYGAFYLTSQFLPPPISLLISMAVGLLLTGAFHEDGFADLCDGFGGGWQQADILRIMKDSRLGTYGVSGLLFILAFKFLSLNYLTENLLLSLLVAHSLSRAFAISLIKVLPYVSADALSKAKPIGQGLKNSDLLILWAITLVPLFFLPVTTSIGLMIMGAIIFALTAHWFKHRLQGYSGDALGASQQIHEIFIYILLIALL